MTTRKHHLPDRRELIHIWTQRHWKSPEKIRTKQTKCQHRERSYLQLMSAGRGEISLCQCSDIGYVSHTTGQVSCLVVVQQHKKDSTCFLLLVVFCCFYCYGLVVFLLVFLLVQCNKETWSWVGKKWLLEELGKRKERAITIFCKTLNKNKYNMSCALN